MFDLPRGAKQWLRVCLLLWAAQAGARDFEFLYIDASEGSASGGHAAIKFDDAVFHFQHVEPGLLRTYRNNFSAFRFEYGDRENRTIRGRRVEVADEVFKSLQAAFERRLLVQNQQFAWLEALNDDLRLLADLKSAAENPEAKALASVELQALGYFLKNYRFGNGVYGLEYAAPGAQLAQLKSAIVAEYGDSFLQEKRLQSLERLKALRPTEQAITLEEDYFVSSMPAFARRYRNQLLNLAALDVLESGIAPRAEALLIAHEGLSAEAVVKLANFRQILFADLIQLMHSERGDWGYPLLVGMARLHALEQSIASDRLVVLDRFRPAEEDAKAFKVEAGDLAAVRTFAEQSLNAAIGRLLQSEHLDEQGYDGIEIGAGFLVRVQAAGGQVLTLPAIDSTPALAAKAELVPLPLTEEELDAYEKRAAARLDDYSIQLSSLYGYDLLSRNCVTEIFRVINASLVRGSGEEALSRTSQRLLGGYIDGSPLNIAPFTAFDQVGSRYRVQAAYRLSPYRERQIEGQYQSKLPVLVDLAESNTLTSSIYRWHGEDSAFLFFTQDNLWTRPLFGTANLAVAAGQAAYGLLAWPWDFGQNLQKSLKGLAVSLPELMFFNIRKGSFPSLVPDVSAANDRD